MDILILGCGQVGWSVAEVLSREQNAVTVVDINAERLASMEERMDINTIIGNASSPRILEKAGAEDADLMLAVTGSDEVNMIACQIASALFHTPKKIARIRAMDYLRHPELFCKEQIPIDVIISPEKIITNQIEKLIEYPGALQVIDFAGGKIRLVAVKAYYGGALVGHELCELKQHLPSVNSRVAAIYRQDKAIIPTGKTIIEADDEVFFIATKNDIRKVMMELRTVDQASKKVLIAGAGNIGFRLAQSLEQRNYQVKLIERDSDHARHVAEQLSDAIVLEGSAADETLLRQENIENMGLFCALTNEDDANILSAMLAKQLGVRRTIAIINHTSYINLAQSSGSVLDIALSPRLSTVSALLSHVRKGDVVAAHPLRYGLAEAIETVVHGNKKTSKIVGRKISEIKLPKEATVGAIMRDDELLKLNSEVVIEDGDHLIILLVDKQKIHDVEKLFQVSNTFF